MTKIPEAFISQALTERDEYHDITEMDEVAHRFAHLLALELECVLADRNTNWDRAMNLIGEYRSAMNAIHEQHSPTFMGEPNIGPTNAKAAEDSAACSETMRLSRAPQPTELLAQNQQGAIGDVFELWNAARAALKSIK